jgi:GNAT superfamily N-acetyltransferase
MLIEKRQPNSFTKSRRALERVNRNPPSGGENLFVCRLAASPRGIAFELTPRLVRTEQCTWLYEIYVPEVMRQKGIGAFLLARVEELARQFGYNKVLLHPKPPLS